MITIEIGGVPVSLCIEDPTLLREVRERFQGYLTVAPEPRFHLDVSISPFRLGDDHTLSIERAGSRWIVRRSDFHAEWDIESARGYIRQVASPVVPPVVLRILYSIMLARDGGFLFHAASAVRNGRAFLFTGLSGAGKTTIARLAPADVQLLTDETSFLRVDHSSCSAFGTPFPGDLDRSGTNIAAPVAAVYFLKKGGRNRVEPLSPGEAFAPFLRNVILFRDDPELKQLCFDAVCRFLSVVPVYRLTFVPDATVWDLIK